jgi:hypothetical protein
MVAVLAGLLVLQIGLCFSTGSTVMPAYVAIFGRSRDSELGLGLMIYQGILCLGTLLMLIVVGIIWLNERHTNKTDEDLHDR